MTNKTKIIIESDLYRDNVRSIFDNITFLSQDEKEDMKIAFKDMFKAKNINEKFYTFRDFEIKYLTLFAQLDKQLRFLTTLNEIYVEDLSNESESA